MSLMEKSIGKILHPFFIIDDARLVCGAQGKQWRLEGESGLWY